jgi:hypothetical protein
MRFTLTAPAGRHVKLTVRAHGTEPSRMSVPAAVTISYERCKRQNLAPALATAWSVDAGTDAAVASIGGDSDPSERTVTFSVDLWSNDGEEIAARGIYAVAY